VLQVAGAGGGPHRLRGRGGVCYARYTMARDPLRYNHLTWQEMNDAIAAQPVVLLPVGSTEQHGPHLPLDVDIFLCEQVCLEIARRMPGKVLVLPPVPYGLNLHHIDFPGTIHIEPEVFIAFCLNVTKSVAYHGFKRILVVNGHGSNAPLADLVARKTVLATESICASVSYYVFGQEAFDGVKESEVTAHADEFETSLYLALAPERVQMERAVAGDDHRARHMSSDSVGKVRFSDWWGRWTTTGVHGDPRPANAEKGKVIWEAVLRGMQETVQDLISWPDQKRRDQHRLPVQSKVQW
jgi:creatinine amidohydrolase